MATVWPDEIYFPKMTKQLPRYTSPVEPLPSICVLSIW